MPSKATLCSEWENGHWSQKSDPHLATGNPMLVGEDRDSGEPASQILHTDDTLTSQGVVKINREPTPYSLTGALHILRDRKSSLLLLFMK